MGAKAARIFKAKYQRKESYIEKEGSHLSLPLDADQHMHVEK